MVGALALLCAGRYWTGFLYPRKGWPRRWVCRIWLSLALHTQPLPYVYSFAEVQFGGWDIEGLGEVLGGPGTQPELVTSSYSHLSLGVGGRYFWKGLTVGFAIRYISEKTLVVKYPPATDEDYIFRIQIPGQAFPEFHFAYRWNDNWEAYLHLGGADAQISIEGLNEGGKADLLVEAGVFRLGLGYRL